MPQDLDIHQLASNVREALGSADLDAYRELLDPHVTWGPPGDLVSGCHSREEVLTWYRRARASGVRADVTNVEVHGDRILVGLEIEGDEGGERWQVLTVANGLVTDIRGYEDRPAAMASMPHFRPA